MRRKFRQVVYLLIGSTAILAFYQYVRFLQDIEDERQYLTPRKVKVNPTDQEFIIKGAQICISDAKYMTLLVVVPSVPSHYFVRDAIRATYGSYSKHSFFIDRTNVYVTVRLMFLVGKDGDIKTDRNIRNESGVYGDIVYADFIESYRNLTRKMLIALKWVSVHCSDIDFFVKVDEDVFVNIPQLAKALFTRPYDDKGTVYGYIHGHPEVRRKGKYGVSKDEFPLSRYPKYAAGNSYVISGNVIPRMYMVSEYLPYMPMEDAFITGCLARIVGSNVLHVPGFTNRKMPSPDPCNFMKDRRISATNVDTTQMKILWKASISFSEMCVKFN